MFDLIRRTHELLATGPFASGANFCSLELIVSMLAAGECLLPRGKRTRVPVSLSLYPHRCFTVFGCRPKHAISPPAPTSLQDPLGAAGTANEGSWGMTPFNGEGVNNNAPMRVGTAPENYQTTGGYALYPGKFASGRLEV